MVVICRSTTGPIAKGSSRRPRIVTPPPHGLSRGKRARSTSSVLTPSRASRCAVSEPAGPAPTTMRSKRSTIGAYDLGMGDSSVRVEDAGDLRVRQAMIARPKSVPRSASVGEARILFENPKNRLLLVDDDGIYAGHVLRDDVPDAEPDEAPLLPHVRRDCPTIGPDESVAAALPLTTRAVREPARRRRRGRDSWRACSASTSATATSAWTFADDGSPPQRADARLLPAARGVPASRARGGRPRGRQADHLRRARGALPPARQCAACARAAPRRARRRALAERAGDPRGALRRAARRRRPGRDQHASGAGRGRPHPAPLRRAGAARRSRARAARRGTRPERHRRRADRRQRPAGGCLRAADRVRRARAARVVARARGGADLDQLHLGHDRARPRASSTRTAART